MLRERGYRVVIVCSPDPGLRAFAESEDVEAVELPMGRGLLSLQDLQSMLSAFRLIRRVRPMLVNVATPKASFVIGLAARLAGVPVRIYSLWGLRLEGEREGSLRFWMLWMAERAVCASATVVLCAGQGVRARAVAMRLASSSKTCVLGQGSTNGVDTVRFSPPMEAERHRVRASIEAGPNDLVVGFVGRIVVDKGVDVLLDAIEQIRKHSSVILLMVGCYEDHDPLPTPLRARLESDPLVRITGLQADTSPWYAAMDVVVLPSRREGLPNVLLEAASCGLPTITSDATGCGDAIDDGRTGVVVPQRDAEGLSCAILAMAADVERRVAMGAAGRAWVQQHFNQNLVWERIADFYDQLTAHPHPHDPAVRNGRRPTSTTSDGATRFVD